MSAQADLERNLIFNLRDAFVRVLLAKAVVSIAKENLDYYDKSLSINRDRYSAGAIAHVDLQRLELQRVQFVSDLATAQVNLRTAKIDLQALLRPQFRAGRESIGDIRLLAPSGERVSLGQVADIQFRDGASQIYRENNSRYVAIKYSVRGRDLGSTVEEAIRTVVSRW